MSTTWPQQTSPRLDGVRLAAWSSAVAGCVSVWLGLALAVLHLT